MPPAKPVLGPKEASLFKELLTFYETRQLKKGLKAADQILKRCPDHGETMAMRGLILVHQGRREDGLESVKKGMRLDLTSHIVWHVFGLVQKGEKKYEEALKSYTQALKFDPDNMNIIRDTASLQSQLRLYPGLVESRHKLLKLRPGLRANWAGLAVAYHLNGDLVDAKDILDKYEAMLLNVPDYDVELSEVLLYHIRILEKLGETEEALRLLDVNAKDRKIVDRTAIMEFRARLLSQTEQRDDAESAWHTLIEQNPEYHEYYRGYFKTKGLDLDAITDSNRPEALELLQSISTRLPRAAAPRRIALSVATGPEFAALARAYLQSALDKGIPSLFSSVKALYRDDAKRQAIEDIVESIRAEHAPPEDQPPPANLDPTVYLWTLYFLAQHHSFLGDQPRSLVLLDIALRHTPTLPELYTAKARALKRAGDPFGAARALDEARLLDGQDRFLNTKCAKYRLRAGMIDEAHVALGLFTKKDAESPGADLEDMQSMLYLIEAGNAYAHTGNLGMALKKYSAVQKVFDEIYDDQFDFHGYAIRKFNLNVYHNMVSWEDGLRSHPGYITAAIEASRIYVRLHDNPELAKNSGSSGSALSDAEKKAKKKAKKAAQKVQETAKPAANTTANEDKGLEPEKTKDDDLDGSKLLACADPLERAARYLSPLTALALKNIDLWIAAYDVAVRRGKYLQAVQALNHARAQDSEHPELHIRTIDLRLRLSEPPSPILASALAALLPPDVSPETHNSQFLQRYGSSAPAVLAAAKVAHTLKAPTDAVEGTLFALFNPDVRPSVQVYQDGLVFLEYTGSARVEEFREACKKVFPRATVFGTKAEIEDLRRRGVSGDLVRDDAEKQELVS